MASRCWKSRYQTVGLALALGLPFSAGALDLNQAMPLPDPVTEAASPTAAQTPPTQTPPASTPGQARGTAPTGQILSPPPPPVAFPAPAPVPPPTPVVVAPPPAAAPPPAPGAPPRADALARMQAMLGRAFSDVERKAVIDAGRAETSELRIVHSDYADRTAALTHVYRGRVIELLPPLNQFAEAAAIDLKPVIERERGMPMTKDEQQGMLNLDASRRQSALAIRQRYVAAIAGRTGLSPQQVNDALNGR
ncbi:hypothetical protein [Lacibacterium aquatile]|uniref:hypothetical protein n=1 Tax=Lacibacterium aquatile TaxID=1168082 RepID=UPI0036D41106